MSEKIGVGVIGMGGRGRYFARTWPEDARCRVVAVCEKDPEVARYARTTVPDPAVTWYDDMAELLADDRVQAVCVATEDRAHAECALAVLAAGKHLFLEKPMAQTIADCDAMIEAWQGTEAVFMVGLELRYCTLCRQMHEILERGDIGPVKVGTAVDNVSVGGDYYFHGPRRRREYIKSLVLEKGTHTLDLMNWFVGAQPVRVYAEGGLDVFGGDRPDDLRCGVCDERDRCPYAILAGEITMDYGERVRKPDGCVWGREVDVDDNTVLTVRYDSGAKITYTECHFTPDYNRHFTLIGTKGRMVGFYNNQQDFRIELSFRHRWHLEVLRPPKVAGGHGGGDPQIRREFLARVQAGRRCCPGVADARNSAAIAIAGEESCQTHRPVEIPPPPAAGP